MAALARGFSDRHFERGEGPGDEVELSSNRSIAPSCFANHVQPPLILTEAVCSEEVRTSCDKNTDVTSVCSYVIIDVI